MLHGGRESSEDTEVFEALCFLRAGFTIEKLREWLDGSCIERPAVILGGGIVCFRMEEWRLVFMIFYFNVCSKTVKF